MEGPAGAGRDGLWSGHGPSGQDPKDERQVVREGVNEDTMQITKPWERVCDEGHGADED